VSGPIITVSDIAKEKIINLVQSRGNAAGILIGVNTKGCSGHSYVLEFCERPDPVFDQVSLNEHVSIYVDPKHLLYVLGLHVDWRRDNLTEGFAFENPNAKGSCGCGESFYV